MIAHKVQSYFCLLYKYMVFVKCINHFIQKKWNKLDLQCHKATYVFRNHLLKSIWPLSEPIYNIHNPSGMQLLTRSRLGLSHIPKWTQTQPQFSTQTQPQTFKAVYNPLCTCTLKIESTSHFFLHCHYYYIHKTLLNCLDQFISSRSKFWYNSE